MNQPTQCVVALREHIPAVWSVRQWVWKVIPTSLRRDLPPICQGVGIYRADRVQGFVDHALTSQHVNGCAKLDPLFFTLRQHIERRGYWFGGLALGIGCVNIVGGLLKALYPVWAERTLDISTVRELVVLEARNINRG